MSGRQGVSVLRSAGGAEHTDVWLESCGSAPHSCSTASMTVPPAERKGKAVVTINTTEGSGFPACEQVSARPLKCADQISDQIRSRSR